MPDDRKPPRTPAKGVALTFADKRDELVQKHATPQLYAPHTIPQESTGVYTRRKIDSVSTSIDQLRLDQARQNNQQEAHAKKLIELDGRIGVVDAKIDGVDGKLDLVLKHQEHAAKDHDRVADVATAHIVADVALGKTRAVTAIEDQADKSKHLRKVILAVIGVLCTGAGAALTHFLGG